MNSLELAKNVDHLGRIVIPMHIRKKLEINAGDALEVFLHKDKGGEYVCFKKNRKEEV
jgi:AbrB family looped-hinge helix DNA binding protein